MAASLGRLVAAYEGLAAASRVFERPDGAREAALVFEDGNAGRAAQLIVEFVLSGQSTWIRRIGAPAREAEASDGGGADICLVGDSKAMSTLARTLAYASTRMLAAPPEAPAPPGDARTLPALLSHALIAFTRDYGAAPATGVPSLPVWSNVLRPLGTEVSAERDLQRRTVLSKRVNGVALRELERLGWVLREKGAERRAPKTARLTGQGLAMEAAGRARVAAVEEAWLTRFGEPRMRRLRAGLLAATARLDIEMPWYLAGYGHGDASLTGGSSVPAEPGPPRVPARGEEFPVVPREREAEAAMPLPALLSWALAAFTLDYEAGEYGSLAWASEFLRRIPAEGLPLGEAKTLCDVKGNGRSGPERHLCLVVAPGRGDDRHVYLTPKSRRMREAWRGQVAEIERKWGDSLGAAVVDDLRDVLADLGGDAWSEFPDYPDTTTWAHNDRLREQGTADTLPDQADTGQPPNLGWMAGQRAEGRNI